jgi:exopolyphosphatase/guanosine-5'-triphosphate,3'-diphosphate pyrophosphatase
VLDVKDMRIAEGAMREGLLYDMLGRFTDEDARERTVRAMQKRYHVDFAQAERVEATALKFLEQTRETWKLDDPLAELALKWAARLHEIGLDVSHSGYHRHGAYLLENADMPGFSREEQRLLARMVGAHRRKPVRSRVSRSSFRRGIAAPVSDRPATARGAATPGPQPDGAATHRVESTPRSLEVEFPARWLKDHPLTSADLQQETEYMRAERLQTAGFQPRQVVSGSGHPCPARHLGQHTVGGANSWRYRRR